MSAPVASFVLGTAALGLPYGFSSDGGRVLCSPEMARSTFDAAASAGWLAADSAPAYGVAEERLGDGWDGPVWSKINSVDLDVVEPSIQRTLRHLRRESIEMIQWHNWTREMLENPAFHTLMESLADDSRVGSIGATTYGVEDASAAADSGLFSWIQVEANLIAPQSLAAAWDARRGNTQISVRSVLLQGLLARRPAVLPPHLAPLEGSLNLLTEIAESEGRALLDLAIRGMLEDPRVGAIVLGCDGPEQVRSAVNIACGAPLSAGVRAQLLDAQLDSPATDPRTWQQ